MGRSPNPFARTREDHRTEVAEDYVELIYRLGESGREVKTTNLVDVLDVAQPTVTKALDRLQREGLVTIHPRRRIELTAEGLQLAVQSRRRHDLIVQFLVSIGVSPITAEIDAEGIEHHVSEETLAAIAQFIRGQK